MTLVSKNASTAIGFAAVIIWGASILWVRIITQDLGNLRGIIAFHSVCAALAFAIWMSLGKGAVMKAALRSRWFYVRLALFCLNVIGFFSAIHCISRERMPLVILINYLWPTIALIASVRVVPIQITRPILFWCGCLVVVLSIAVELLYDRSNIIALIAGSATQDATAYIFAFLAALSWGTYSAITRRWGDESGGPVVAPLFSAASVAVALIALPYMPQPTIHFDLTTAVCLLGGALLGVVAFWCWDLGIRKGNIVLLSLQADATPWVSLTTSHLALDVPLHDATIASAILLVTGAVLTRCGVLASKLEESTC